MWPFKRTPSEREIALRKEYEKYLELCLPEERVPIRDGLFAIRAVAELAENKIGRLGVVVARNWRGNARAVHEINLDGTFSKKRPYWTKLDWKSCRPRRFAVCQFVIPVVQRREEISTIGHSIIEMDTSFRPRMTFDEWKWELAPSKD